MSLYVGQAGGSALSTLFFKPWPQPSQPPGHGLWSLWSTGGSSFGGRASHHSWQASSPPPEARCRASCLHNSRGRYSHRTQPAMTTMAAQTQPNLQPYLPQGRCSFPKGRIREKHTQYNGAKRVISTLGIPREPKVGRQGAVPRALISAS